MYSVVHKARVFCLLCLLSVSILAACSKSEETTVETTATGQLTIWHSYGDSEQEVLKEVAQKQDLEANFVYVDRRELLPALEKSFGSKAGPDLVISDVICTPLWCKEDLVLNPNKVWDLDEILVEDLKEWLPPICDPRYCDPPEAFGLPVAWKYLGLFVNNAWFEERKIDAPKTAADVDKLLKTFDPIDLVGWCGTPPRWPFPFPPPFPPDPDPWFDKGLINAHSGQIGLLQETLGEISVIKDLAPMVTLDRAFISANSSQLKSATQFVNGLLDAQSQLSLHEASGLLPTSEVAVDHLVEKGLADLVSYGLDGEHYLDALLEGGKR